MPNYDPAGYGRAVGDDYDALYPGEPGENEAASQLLAALAREHSDSSFLEFGIGTGRLALAVQDAGIRVAGIDGAEHMVARLRGKAGGDRCEIRIGDYRSTSVGSPHSFAVVALAFNGIFDPRGLDAQLDIFRNAERHLLPGGYFVVESWVMNDVQKNGAWSVIPRYVGPEHVELQLARFDPETNQMERTLVHLRPEGARFVSVRDTYASPAELDLMAHVAGFERHVRYADWDRSRFAPSSTKCVAVYRRDS